MLGGAAVNVTVLHIEDCPNVKPLLAELEEVLGGAPGVVLSVVCVLTEAEGSRLGFHGSPTVLVDGRDPFPAPPGSPRLSCRLYRDAAGRVLGYPAREELAAALRIEP